MSYQAPIASAQDGKAYDLHQDTVVMTWSNSNWGDNLRFAPLSLALLGSLLVMAAENDDFSFVDGEDAAAVANKFQHIETPSSFKACLRQTIEEGYYAFGTANENMSQIYSISNQITTAMKKAMILASTRNAQDIKTILPGHFKGIETLTQACVDLASEIEVGFGGLSALAQEIAAACAEENEKRGQNIVANNEAIANLKARLGLLPTQRLPLQHSAYGKKEKVTAAERDVANADHSNHSLWRELVEWWYGSSQEDGEKASKALARAKKDYEHARKLLADHDSETGKVSLEITNLEQANEGLLKKKPVFDNAVVAFTELRAELSNLVSFFGSIKLLLNGTLVPSAKSWSDLLTGWITHHGQPLPPVLYQMRIAMLSERISRTYVNIAEQVIRPAHQKIGDVLPRDDQKTADNLTQVEQNLSSDANKAGEVIVSIVAEAQKTFIKEITDDLEKIRVSFSPVPASRPSPQPGPGHVHAPPSFGDHSHHTHGPGSPPVRSTSTTTTTKGSGTLSSGSSVVHSTTTSTTTSTSTHGHAHYHSHFSFDDF
ncbi:hypothetical protein BDN72DRAFT_848035 [Pluteus cervinus]|uniref:Uncharacterized protein n=1 Tax=Pluteus cervinus TaxID=181527 RepID=A0ACD3ACN4_9AGAR|nr:hypothetical protein BDN72DRAFT_848035 [Pluteus cervinus]